MKFNFWQFVNEKFSGMKAGDAAYRAQADTVKAAAPMVESLLVQSAVQSAASQAEKVLPLGGLTAGLLGTILTGNEASNETSTDTVKGQ